jgi:hypothetical protein
LSDVKKPLSIAFQIESNSLRFEMNRLALVISDDYNSSTAEKISRILFDFNIFPLIFHQKSLFYFFGV